MNLNIKEEVDDTSFIPENCQNEIDENEIELIETKIEFFQCEDCSQQFQIFELYELHKTVHGTGKICPQCKRPILKSSTFIKHIESHIKNYIKCEYCPKIFFGKQIYIIHLRWHKIESRFQCIYCNRGFFTEKDLSIHVRLHTDKPPYKCDDCDKTLRHFSSLRKHIQTHDKGNINLCDKAMQMEKPKQTKLKKRKRRCFLCGIGVDWTRMKQHQDIHVKAMYDEAGGCELSSAYRCKECDDVLTTKRKALIHSDEHMKRTHTCEHPDCHAAPSMTYMGYMRHKFKLHKTVRCDDCNRQFTRNAGLAKHRASGYCPEIASNSTKMDKGALSLRVHENSVKPPKFDHGDQKTKGQCSICNERFETKKSYEDHMKKRHGPQCEKCKRKFTSMQSFKFHVKRGACSDRAKDARQNEDGTVTCLLCSKITVNIHTFYRHADARHPYPNQDVFCKYCACCLSGVTMMMKHLEEQHPDEDKYVCLLCEKTFKSFKRHMRHKREHTGKHVRRTQYVVQLNEIICGAQVKKELVDDNFVDVPEHVVVQQNGEVLSVAGDQ